ncbi:MAG: class I SAM-dependent methyltransferase [Candidatus Liptonbacteria bacterium]
MIDKALSKIKSFLAGHAGLRNFVRDARWHIKRIPVLRDLSIAFDSYYFSKTGTERKSDGELIPDAYFESYASEISSRAKGDVLDLGCGYGYLTKRIAESGQVNSIVAMDKIDDFRCHHDKIEYKTGDINLAEIGAHRYDTIVTSEFVEHLSEENYRVLLGKVARALRPGGSYLGSTPNNPTPYKTFSGSRFHAREYSQKDLLGLLGKYFHKVEVFPSSVHCLIWEAKSPKANA